MKLRIHTQGWVGDRGKKPGEEAGASIHCVLEIDGQLITEVARVRTLHSNDGFTMVVAHLIPGELETVVHDHESWEELLEPRRALYKRWLGRKK